jgi:hypothetical protein
LGPVGAADERAHLPILGALHPKAVGPHVLRDVLAIAGTGQFLPYDKDRRWGGEKDESIMDGIEVQADHVLIPTLNRRTNTVTSATGNPRTRTTSKR